MRNKLNSTKTTIICCIIIGVLVIGLSVYVAFSDSNRWLKEAGVTPAPTTVLAPTQVALPTYGDTNAVVLVVAADSGQSKVKVYEPEQDVEYELFYTGTTDIRDRFGSVIAGMQIDVGSIAEVSFDAESGRMYFLYQIEPDWCYEKQSNVELNVEKGILTVAGNNYRVSKNTAVLEAGEQILISELAAVDELSVLGMGDRTFLIERSKGHGVLQIKNSGAFVGGRLFIDGKNAEEVKGEMHLTMREGDYHLKLVKGDMCAEKTLVVPKNAVVQWDLAEFLPAEPVLGRVEFLLEPEDAELYIDNERQRNKAFAELEYGEHVLGLYKDGYVGWTGKITVSTEEMVFSVSLVPEPIPTPTSAPTPPLTEIPTDTSRLPDSIGAKITPTPEAVVTPSANDLPHTETEQELEGKTEEREIIEVQIVWYPTSVVSLDSAYVGMTDASGVLAVKLQSGTHVVELTRILLDGSTQPKKYTVDVNAQTTVLNFLLEN